MARSYKRDKNGRFAGGGGGGGSRGGGSKPIQRGTNRLTRDNAGRITSQGGDGATARGGRLATASGNKRATQTAKLSGGGPKGTVGKPKGLKPGAIKPKAANAVKAATSTSTRQARAAANVSRTNAAKPLPGNRRLTKAQVRSQVRTESALKIYKGGEAAQREIRNAQGLARTERARNNWVQTRDQRLANAKAASMPLVGVGKAPKPAAPIRRRSAVGKIDDAKAGRIVARIDANRPGRSLANGSARKTANSIRTHERAVEFALASSRRAMRKGSSRLSVNQSLQRAVANASKKTRK